MGKTRGEWARGLLLRMYNVLPSREMILWVSAWTKAENTRAKYNPLATKWDMPGSTQFNTEGIGVKNYLSEEMGYSATLKTLDGKYPGYDDIREGMRTNDVTRAQRGLSASPWGTNAAKVAEIYKGSDISGEQLPSFADSESGGIEWVATPGGLAPLTPEQKEEYENTGRVGRNTSYLEQGVESLTVSESDARRVTYGVGGVLLFMLGIYLLVRNVLPVPSITVSK